MIFLCGAWYQKSELSRRLSLIFKLPTGVSFAMLHMETLVSYLHRLRNTLECELVG